MKKLNQKGFAHVAVAGIALLVLGVVGFTGYKVYQNRQVKAKAAGYTLIYNAGGIVVKACKTPVYTGYGLLYNTRVVIDRGSNRSINWYSFSIIRPSDGNKVIHNVNANNWSYGRYVTVEKPASAVLKDIWHLALSERYDYWNGGGIIHLPGGPGAFQSSDPGALLNC